MINSNKHIINKVSLEVNTNSKEKAYYLKDNITSFLQQELYSMLENYFDSIDQKNPLYSIQLEKLDVEFSLNPSLNFDDFKKEVVNKVKERLEKYFEIDGSNSDKFKLIKKEDKDLNQFYAFLEKGLNPWWYNSQNHFEKNIDDAFYKMINDQTFSKKLLDTFTKTIPRSRFIKQFNDEQILMFLNKELLQKINTERAIRMNEISNQEKAKTKKDIKKTQEINTEYQKEIPIDFQKIKKRIQNSTTKSIENNKLRNLVWDIILMELSDSKNSISTKNAIQQKLFYLIYTLLKHKQSIENGRFEHSILTKEIIVQLQNKSAIAILTNLDSVLFKIEQNIKVLLDKNLQNAIALENAETKQNNKDKKNSLESSSKKELFEKSPNSKMEPIIDNEISKDSLEIKSQGSENILSKKEISLNDINEIEKSINDETLISEKPADYYIENAGLILVHPFLIHLFKNCNLIENNTTFNDPELAVHLLHYIATGREQDYEYEMIFEKFLCNVPPLQPINRTIVLTKELKNQGDKMLKAVLENWSIMKNSSLDLLRNEYLQRPGKIILNENNPRLIVERKTQDILLDKLNWNLSIVKLAWKDKIMYVEW